MDGRRYEVRANLWGSTLPIADLGLRVILICQEGYTSSLAADAQVDH